jgi:hypothetical protein
MKPESGRHPTPFFRAPTQAEIEKWGPIIEAANINF